MGPFFLRVSYGVFFKVPVDGKLESFLIEGAVGDVRFEIFRRQDTVVVGKIYTFLQLNLFCLN